MKTATEAMAMMGLALLLLGRAEAAQSWPVDPQQHQVGPQSAASAPACRAATPVLTNRSVGPLRLGQSLRNLQATCRNLVYGWYGAEGLWTPVVLVRLGKVGLMVEFSGTTSTSTVYRIVTSSHHARTAEGLGPGAFLSALAAAWGTPTFGVGECDLYASFSRRPGLCFRVDLPNQWDCLASVRVEESQDIALVPQRTRVAEVLLFSRNP